MILLNGPNTKKISDKYIQDCLKTNWISTSGRYIDFFKRKLKNITKSKYVNLLNSGTSSLHIALKVVGVSKDNEVICPSLTFIASINPILYLGANPIFFDCDEYHNINVLHVVEFLNNNTYFKNNFTYNSRTKKIIKAIIIVHMWGNVCDFRSLLKICKKKNIKIIEDASESLGSYYINKNKKIHTGSLGDVGCLSFNGNKIITCGSGGAILTNNAKYHREANYYASQAKDDPIRFIHNDIGYNYRMPNINAALGLGQLNKLNSFLKKKREIRQWYHKKLKSKKYVELCKVPSGHINNFWLNIIKLNKKYRYKPYDLYLKFKKKNIETRMIWFPCHLQKKLKLFQKYNIKNTRKYFDTCLCLPSGTLLTEKEIEKVVNIL